MAFVERDKERNAGVHGSLLLEEILTQSTTERKRDLMISTNACAGSRRVVIGTSLVVVTLVSPLAAAQVPSVTALLQENTSTASASAQPIGQSLMESSDADSNTTIDADGSLFATATVFLADANASQTYSVDITDTTYSIQLDSGSNGSLSSSLGGAFGSFSALSRSVYEFSIAESHTVSLNATIIDMGIVQLTKQFDDFGTVFEFTSDAVVEDLVLDAGSYSFFVANSASLNSNAPVGMNTSRFSGTVVDFQLTLVPAPGTPLLATGIAALGLVRRRR